MPKKFESDQEAVFSMAFLTKVITIITIVITIIYMVDIIMNVIIIIIIIMVTMFNQINQKKMRRLEKEYTTMKSKEKEVRLRNINTICSWPCC